MSSAETTPTNGSSSSATPDPMPPEAAVQEGTGRDSGVRRRGGRVASEVKDHALLLVASGVRPSEVARLVGISGETLRLWRRKAEQSGTMPVAPTTSSTVPTTSPMTTVPEEPASAEAPRDGETAPDEPMAPPAASEVQPTVETDTSASRAPRVPERAPKDPGSGLSDEEVAAIVDLRQRYGSMGPAQLRAQLKRFRGWRVSTRAIARVLREHGFDSVHVGSRPKGQEEDKFERFEAPRRNALWQMDFAELRVGKERVSLLVVLDDFSRYVTGYALFVNPASENVVSVLEQAIRRHGQPQSVYTDRGGPFLAWGKPTSLGAFLEENLIDHHVSPAYRPMGRGKVEALIGTVKRELWNLEHFASIRDAELALEKYFSRYNHQRAHMGIDGLTPADRFFGRWEDVRNRMEAASRGRQTARVATLDPTADPFVTEEPSDGGTAEVLRLLARNGRMELRFFGHRVNLGPIEP